MIAKFTLEELKQFPLLEKIQIDMEVIATNASDYKGLKGYICEAKYGKDKDTDNEDIVDIYVDFVVPEYVTEGLDEDESYEAMEKFLEEHYPVLNGTSISEVIMGEDMLGFKFDSNSDFYIGITGKVICPNCHCEIGNVTETQHDDREWNFIDGKYVKQNLIGDSDGIKCGHCGEAIEFVKTMTF